MNTRKALTAALVSSLLLLPSLVGAIGLQQEPGFVGTVPGGVGLVDAVRRIINWLLMLAGLIAVIYLIIGGVRYITSRGDEDAATEAKNTILYAVIGLIVIGLSAVVVNFILQSFQ